MQRRLLGLVVAAVAVVIVLALLLILVLGETERSGGSPEEQPPPVRQAANQQVRFTLSVTPDTPKVGELATLSGRLVDARTGRPVGNVRYEVTGWHLEDDVALFTAKFTSLDGTFTWGYHFWDGVEYELRVAVAPLPEASVQFAPLSFQGNLEVEPVAPPVWVQVRATLYLLAVTAVGLVIGIPIGSRVRGIFARPHPPAAREPA